MKKFTTDHRIRVTRMLIRGAFTDLMQRKPIQGITVKELCERAGVNRGTFYGHYTDIYDLRDEIEDEMAQEFQKALAPIFAADRDLSEPVNVTQSIFECLKDNSDLCAVTLGEYGDKEFLFRILSIGRQLCLDNYAKFFKNASPTKIDFFYAFVSSGCIGLLRKWLEGGMTITSNELAEMTESMIRNGIGFLE